MSGIRSVKIADGLRGAIDSWIFKALPRLQREQSRAFFLKLIKCFVVPDYFSIFALR
jgi:hypothetical protein